MTTTTTTNNASGPLNLRVQFPINDQRRRRRVMMTLLSSVTLIAVLVNNAPAQAASLQAGVGKVDITHPEGLVNDRSFVRALVLKNEATTVAIVTVDVVAIGEIGSIGNDYLAAVRARIEKELGIPPHARDDQRQPLPRHRLRRRRRTDRSGGQTGGRQLVPVTRRRRPRT